MGEHLALGFGALLGCFHRWLGAERRRFVDEKVDAEDPTYRLLAIVCVPVESLFPVQVRRGPVPISSTPLFSFVKAHLGHEGAAWNKNDWKKYMAHESASSVSAIAQRQGRFERLIDESIALNSRLRGFEVVDGFHRAAILAACKPGSTVSCSLVSHTAA